MFKIIQDGSEKRFFQTCRDCQTDYIYQTDDVCHLIKGLIKLPFTECPKCNELNEANFIETCINIEGKRPAQEGD